MIPKIMLQVGEEDLVNPHEETNECAQAGCVPDLEPICVCGLFRSKHPNVKCEKFVDSGL